jgi:O-antigen/teichoic acid export membrane protein
MGLGAKIAQNTGIQIIGKILATVLGIASVLLMTRYLDPAGFGAYTTIITFLSFFALIADLGLTLVTVQMISDPEADENKILNNLFTFRLISILILIGIAPLIALFFPYSANLKMGILITALSFVFPALNQILVGLFQKKLTMNKVALAEVIGRIIILVGVIVAIKFNLGLNFILWILVISAAINFLIQFVAARRFVKLKLAFDYEIWRRALSKSWPLALTIVFNLIYLKTDTLILSLLKPQFEVGLYGAAYRVIDILITLPYMFSGIILSILTTNWLTKKYDNFRKVFQKSYDFMIILAIPLTVGAQFLSTEIMTTIGGEKFAAAGPILRILTGAASLIFISCILAHAIIAVDRARRVIGAYAFTSVTAVIGYLYFIPKFSYIGAAWMTIYSEAIITILLALALYKHTKIRINFKITFKALIASGIMALFIFCLPKNLYIQPLGLILVLISSTIVYTLTLLLIKAINKEDIKMFMPGKNSTAINDFNLENK